MVSRKRYFLYITISILVGACAHQPLREPVAWVAYSDEWQRQACDVYSDAQNYISLMAKNYPENHWAVVMDLDETVLNNVAYQIMLEHTGQSYTEASWHNWASKQLSTLVPCAQKFIETVNESGGHIVFITNRRHTLQLATEENLHALGITHGEDFIMLLTRTTDNRDKTARFAVVPNRLEALGYPNTHVVAYIGDTVGDKPYALRNAAFFCINQGGMYGQPCAQ